MPDEDYIPDFDDLTEGTVLEENACRHGLPFDEYCEECDELMEDEL